MWQRRKKSRRVRRGWWQREKASVAAMNESERGGEKMYSQPERRRKVQKLNHYHTHDRVGGEIRKNGRKEEMAETHP